MAEVVRIIAVSKEKKRAFVTFAECRRLLSIIPLLSLIRWISIATHSPNLTQTTHLVFAWGRFWEKYLDMSHFPTFLSHIVTTILPMTLKQNYFTIYFSVTLRRDESTKFAGLVNLIWFCSIWYQEYSVHHFTLYKWKLNGFSWKNVWIAEIKVGIFYRS